MPPRNWTSLQQAIVDCRRCPRLMEHCQRVAVEKRKAYADFDYWGRPVPNFGPRRGRILIVGLAPGAHGANRTGRMFTGDRSGDWLYRALHRAGLCNQPTSSNIKDGLRLTDCAITAVCHCAPPDNKPTVDEVSQCSEWFQETLRLVAPKVYVALGGLAWKAVLREAKRQDWLEGKMPKFGHGEQVQFRNSACLIGSYHPSQQNTFTGRLTESMLDDIFDTASKLVDVL